jgi:hypothetical protein
LSTSSRVRRAPTRARQATIRGQPGRLSGRGCDVPDFAFLRSLRSRSLVTACRKSSCGGSAKRGPRSVAHPSHRFALPHAAAGVPRATLVTIVERRAAGVGDLAAHERARHGHVRQRLPRCAGHDDSHAHRPRRGRPRSGRYHDPDEWQPNSQQREPQRRRWGGIDWIGSNRFSGYIGFRDRSDQAARRSCSSMSARNRPPVITLARGFRSRRSPRRAAPSSVQQHMQKWCILLTTSLPGRLLAANLRPLRPQFLCNILLS